VRNEAYWVDSTIPLRERIVRMDAGSEEHAFGVEEPWIDGWDCTVVFDDEVVGGLDWEKLDQLRENLAASEGITDVLHEDREVFHLKILGLDFPSVEAKVTEAVEQTDIGDPLYTANPIAVCSRNFSHVTRIRWRQRGVKTAETSSGSALHLDDVPANYRFI
jgi:hypothetical protein